MGLMAARAAGRMGARQQYRTMARMQRRRTWAQDKMGARQDFQQAGEEEYVPAEPAQSDYTAELERLAKLRDEGVITQEDFDAKKQQLLGL